MPKTRVLLVDDAVVVRRLVADVLGADPALEVTAAANGRIALDKLAQVKPDVVILDLEMPGLDGLETLKALRRSHPALPVIIFSQHTHRGAAATLEALALGASDYVTKPENAGGIAAALQQVREQLVPRIKHLCAPRAEAGETEVRRARPTWSLGRRVDVVVVGVSTGGPNALAALLPALPADFPVPVLIVQHMPPLFTRLLAERLAGQTAVGVCEARQGEALLPGTVRVAPGDYHLSVGGGREDACLRLHQGLPENSCRPAADVLFRSAAEVYGSGVLAVVLTGMGQDGLRGCETIRDGGGQVVVQDEASSVVWGMPGAVARAGLADLVLPLEQLADEIVRRARRGRSPSSCLGRVP